MSATKQTDVFQQPVTEKDIAQNKGCNKNGRIQTD
jgi:hypothetical protein